MPLQFQTAHLNPRQYFACGKGIRPRPEPLPSYIDIVYVDFTVRRRFVIQHNRREIKVIIYYIRLLLLTPPAKERQGAF